MNRIMMTLAAGGLLAIAGGCRSSEANMAYYANPVDACAAIEDDGDRERCIKDVVADVAASARREQDRRRGP